MGATQSLRYVGAMTDYEKVEKVIRYLDAHHDEQPDLKTLARVAFTIWSYDAAFWSFPAR